MTVITDLVEFHLGWMFRHSDLTVVPTERARAECLSAGLPEEKVKLLGLPVDLLPALAHGAGIEHLKVVPSTDLNVTFALSLTVFLLNNNAAAASVRTLRMVPSLGIPASLWAVDAKG